MRKRNFDEQKEIWKMLIDDPIHRYVERESSYINPSSCIVVKLFMDNKDLNERYVKMAQANIELKKGIGNVKN